MYTWQGTVCVRKPWCFALLPDTPTLRSLRFLPSQTFMDKKKLLTVVLVVALAILAYVNYTKRVQIASELKQLSVKMEQLQTGNNPESVAEAKAIVELVRKHIELDMTVEPTVATIVDVEALKSRNEFYKNAKNGDHLIVTPTRAVLYDPDKDVILDVVPVQLQASSSSAATK